ncbi:MAG TPA: hypothetical protein VKS99_05920, partial [Blastocatellia bacterium]|nr:hypothetical protein [Blastocatellia bacterium]
MLLLIICNQRIKYLARAIFLAGFFQYFGAPQIARQFLRGRLSSVCRGAFEFSDGFGVTSRGIERFRQFVTDAG